MRAVETMPRQFNSSALSASTCSPASMLVNMRCLFHLSLTDADLSSCASRTCAMVLSRYPLYHAMLWFALTFRSVFRCNAVRVRLSE